MPCAARQTSLEADIGATNDFRNAYKYDGLSRPKRLGQDKQGSGAGYNAVVVKRVELVDNQSGRYAKITRYSNLAGALRRRVGEATRTLAEYAGRVMRTVPVPPQPASAVVGSMTPRTSEIRFAGKPPCRACRSIKSRLGAM